MAYGTAESVSSGRHVLNRILSLSFPHLKAKKGKPVGSRYKVKKRGEEARNGPVRSLKHGGRDEREGWKLKGT